MWKIKTFKSINAYHSWIEKNKHKHQIKKLFINNAWALEYKPLMRVY